MEDHTNDDYMGNTGMNDINSNDIMIDTELSMQDFLLNDSRITPSGNGNISIKTTCTQPTNGQKWWAAVILGLLFAIVSSPPAYIITSSITKNTFGISLMEGPGPNFWGLLIHTLLFILIIRFILW